MEALAFCLLAKPLNFPLEFRIFDGKYLLKISNPSTSTWLSSHSTDVAEIEIRLDITQWIIKKQLPIQKERSRIGIIIDSIWNCFILSYLFVWIFLLLPWASKRISIRLKAYNDHVHLMTARFSNLNWQCKPVTFFDLTCTSKLCFDLKLSTRKSDSTMTLTSIEAIAPIISLREAMLLLMTPFFNDGRESDIIDLAAYVFESICRGKDPRKSLSLPLIMSPSQQFLSQVLPCWFSSKPFARWLRPRLKNG